MQITILLMEKAEEWGRWGASFCLRVHKESRNLAPAPRHLSNLQILVQIYQILVMFSHSLIQSVTICLVIKKRNVRACTASVPPTRTHERTCIHQLTNQETPRSHLEKEQSKIFPWPWLCSEFVLLDHCSLPPAPGSPHSTPPALHIVPLLSGPRQALRPHKALLDSVIFCSYQPEGIYRPLSPPKIPTGLCLTLRFMAFLTFGFGSWLCVSMFIS